MFSGARINPSIMSDVLFAMPAYKSYWKPDCADEEEGFYRLTLGTMLKDSAQCLVNLIENPAHILSSGQKTSIENNINMMRGVFEQLHRQGEIQIDNDSKSAIKNLELLDNHTIMLLETVWADVISCLKTVGNKKRFIKVSSSMEKTLQKLAFVTEERNHLLGLGWESEIDSQFGDNSKLKES